MLFPPFSAILFGALLLLGLIHLPFKIFLAKTATNPIDGSQLSMLFTPEVLRWKSEILNWAAEHGLDPNLVATIMQIESCGNPSAVSSAGAQGLFQVMPYHFVVGENGFSPDINAFRGLNYLRKSLDGFDGNVSLTLAGYNGGISTARRPLNTWPQETRDYVYWGERIYADAATGKQSSPALEEWLAAGGVSLCAQAERHSAGAP